MDFLDAIKLTQKGKSVRRSAWSVGTYLFMGCDDGEFSINPTHDKSLTVNQDGSEYFYLSRDSQGLQDLQQDIFAVDWSECVFTQEPTDRFAMGTPDVAHAGKEGDK